MTEIRRAMETCQMKLLKTEDVAEMLQVSTSTVKNYVDEKGLPCVDLGTNPKRKTLRFRTEDIEEWIAKQVKGAEPKPRRRRTKTTRIINRY